MALKNLVLAFAGAGLAAILVSAPASAAPLAAGLAQPADPSAVTMAQHRRGWRGQRGYRHYGRRGIGPGGAAAILGLGVLGAAAAAQAAQCYANQPVVDPWGNVVGYRRVYVC